MYDFRNRFHTKFNEENFYEESNINIAIKLLYIKTLKRLKIDAWNQDEILPKYILK